MLSIPELFHFHFAIFNVLCVWYILMNFLPFSMGVLTTLVINAGLAWDNSILALGSRLNSDLLLSLSRPRFWLHSFVPILSIALSEAIDRTTVNSDFLLTRTFSVAAVLASMYHLSTMIRGKGLDLERKSSNGIVHFTVKHVRIIEIVPAVVVTVASILAGVFLGCAGLAAGALAMLTVAGAFPPGRHPYGGVLSNLGECSLMAGFIALEEHLRRQGL